MGDEVTVRMPGGSLDIRFSEGTVLMTGLVEKTVEGGFGEDLVARILAGARDA